MKQFFLRVSFLLLALSASRANAEFGELAHLYRFGASRLLVDPARPRMYAAVPDTNSVVILDTSTFAVLASVPVGPDPVDLALSPDDATLYIANHGSADSAVSVFDVATFVLKARFSLPTATVAIAAGLDNRLYASAGSPTGIIYQLDAANGAQQATFHTDDAAADFLQISPDRKTLYAGTRDAYTGGDPSNFATIECYDVSTPTARLVQRNLKSGTLTVGLSLSHNGQYLCLPSLGGNDDIAGSLLDMIYRTALYSTADIQSYLGTFYSGQFVGQLAFSPDDSFAYQLVAAGLSNPLILFDTQTFLELDRTTLPVIFTGPSVTVSDFIVENTGSFIYVPIEDSSDANRGSAIMVLKTGKGPDSARVSPPIITSSTAAAGSLSNLFYYKIEALNTPSRFGATGLPVGVTVNTSTGEITGSFKASGIYQIAVSASNATATDTSPLTLTVSNTNVLPLVTVDREVTATSVGESPAIFLLTRTGDTSYPLDVSFTLEGTAVNGIDFKMIPLHKKIKAGQTQRRVKIAAMLSAFGPRVKRTARLVLHASDSYEIGKIYKIKVKILPVSTTP